MIAKAVAVVQSMGDDNLAFWMVGGLFVFTLLYMAVRILIWRFRPHASL